MTSELSTKLYWEAFQNQGALDCYRYFFDQSPQAPTPSESIQESRTREELKYNYSHLIYEIHTLEDILLYAEESERKPISLSLQKCNAQRDVMHTVHPWLNGNSSEGGFGDSEEHSRLIQRTAMCNMSVDDKWTFATYLYEVLSDDERALYEQMSIHEKERIRQLLGCYLHDISPYDKIRGHMALNKMMIDEFADRESAIPLAYVLMRLPRKSVKENGFEISLPSIVSVLFEEQGDRWVGEISAFINAVFKPIQQEFQKEHHSNSSPQPFMDITGSFVRRLVGESPLLQRVSKLLSEAIPKLPPGEITAMLTPLCEGVFDLDGKINNTYWPISVEDICDLLCNTYPHTSFSNGAQIKYGKKASHEASMHIVPLYAGMSVLSINHKSSDAKKPPFCIDIAPWPEPTQMEYDYRTGTHLSTKRESSLPLYSHGSRFYALYDNNTHPMLFGSLSNPSTIERVSFNSLEQALYAGINLIRLELFHPSSELPQIRKTNINPDMILEFRNVLDQLLSDNALRSTPLSEYRRGEIMREAIIVLCANPQFSSRVMSLLGIGEAFEIEDELEMLSICNRITLEEFISTQPEFLIYLASLFDTKRINKD